jgi:hypothetical protein
MLVREWRDMLSKAARNLHAISLLIFRMRHKNPDAVTIPESAKSIVETAPRLDKLQNRNKPALVYHYLNASIEYAALTVQLKVDNGNNTNIIILASHKKMPTMSKCDIVKVMRNNPMTGEEIKSTKIMDKRHIRIALLIYLGLPLH